MKKIIVTGCDGQLGKAIAREFAGDASFEIYNYGYRQLDICDLDTVASVVNELKPYAVVNCAAYAKVDDCERQIDSAYRINAIGPRNLAMASDEAGAKLVHFSTDYVFDGNAAKPYTEFDRADPRNVYGASKMAGENFVKELGSRYFILRTSGLYGDGVNFVRTMLDLSKTHGEVRVVGDQVGTPTSAKEISRAVHDLIKTENYGLFHASCEGECTWADFAKEIFRLAGLPTGVVPITSAEYNSPAKRPAYSVLDNCMLRLTTNFTFIPWQDALRDYLGAEQT